MSKLPLLPRYILCRYDAISNSSKTNKIPLNPSTLIAHNPQDPSIHIDYNTAKQAAELLGEGYGIGFVLMPEDKYFCIDLDNCLNTDGTWKPIVSDTLIKFPGAYAEVSNSKCGIHIIGRYEGDQLNPGSRSSGIEVYTSKRFIALAEIDAHGDGDTIHTVAITQFIKDNFKNKKINKQTKDLDWSTESHPDCNPPADNLELIDFLLNKKLNQHEVPFSGKIPIPHFKHLFEANEEVLSQSFPPDTNDVFDRSRADLALANTLHYFLGGNCERVEQIMRLSKLYRDKWDNHKTYLPDTIAEAPGRFKKCFAHSHRQKNINSNSSNNQQKILESSLYPELSSKFKALDTSNNLKYLLDIFKISIRWNSMAREREIEIPNTTLFIEDSENSSLRLIEDLALLNEMPIFRIDKNLNTIAQRDHYHPIVEGLKTNPWDGVSRLDEFINTIESSTPKLSYKLIKRWMISAIAAIHSKKGFASSGVLVLAGEQNIGKTRWIKALDPFECNAIKGGALLDPTNKDCIRTLSSFWIVELGELDASFRKSDIARIKSYLTEDMDKIRFPYERKDSLLQRRTVFAASVNDPNFLVDETGNRRWWTIPVISINDNHGLDMPQVWAEVYSIWVSGEQAYLTQEEFNELNIHNLNHEQLNPLEEALYTFYDFELGWERKQKCFQSATDVLRHLGYDKPTKAQCTQMGKIITKVTGLLPQKTKTGRFHQLVFKSKST